MTRRPSCPACADARDVTLLDGTKVRCGFCEDPPARHVNPLTADHLMVVDDHRRWQIAHADDSTRFPELDDPVVVRASREQAWTPFSTLRDALRWMGHAV